MHKKERGFTLIEIIIVVAIIGILFAIAIPQYQAYKVRATMVDVLTMVKSVKTRMEVFHSDHGYWPSDNAMAGLPNPKEITSDYVARVKILAGGDPACGIISLGLRADESLGLGALTGTYVWFKPKDPESDETIEWYCGIPNVKKNESLVPKECRNPRKKSCS